MMRWINAKRARTARVPLQMALIVCSFFAVAKAADPSPPVPSPDGGFIREWLVLGPFPSDDLGTDFLAEYGGEANARPQEGDVVAVRDGRKLVWKRYRS